MQQILCYGDSITWGVDPADDTHRHEWPQRWPGVLQSELGEAYHVVEDGLNSRTTVYDDPLLPYRSGRMLLASALECHAPLDLVVIMLGTNDISYRQISAAQTADGAGELAHLVQRSQRGPGGGEPQVLLVCPPPVGPFGDNLPPGLAAGADVWTRGAVEKSLLLPQEFARVAAEIDVPWMDAGGVITTSTLDGWHLEVSQHQLLGAAIAAEVRRLLERNGHDPDDEALRALVQGDTVSAQSS